MNRLRTSVLALALACAVTACRPVGEESLPPEAPLVRVQVAAARRGGIADVLRVIGQIEALTTLRLASPVAGRITMLSVRPGDQLADGAVAARVIPLENQAAVHGFALLNGAGALSPVEQDTVRKLRNDIRGDVPLRVPFPAVVAERLRSPGEQVAQNDVLLELFDPHSLYVLAQAPMEAARRIDVGQAVDVRTGDMHVTGQVVALVTAAAPQALTLPVRIALRTPLPLPVLHAAVECEITVAQHSDALLIPRSALVSSTKEQTATVMVAVSGRTERREIQVGLRTPAEVEVTAGLGSDDVVLTQGQYALADGTRIETAAGTTTAEAAAPDAAPAEPGARDRE